MILNEETYRGSLYWMASSVPDVITMLKKNSMQLKPRLSKSKDGFPYKELYYKSFSRMKLGGYIKTLLSYGDRHTITILEFDGEKLNRTFKIKPFSFYNWKDEYPKEHYLHNETEEVLISDKPEIKNIRSYIKVIHFYTTNLTNIEELYDYNIPVYVHTKEGLEHMRKGIKNPDTKDFEKANDKKDIDILPPQLIAIFDMFFPPKDPRPNSTYYPDELFAVLKSTGYSYNTKRRKMLEAILAKAKKKGITEKHQFIEFFNEHTIKSRGGNV